MLFIKLILSGLSATILMVLVQKLYVTVSQRGITLTELFSYLLIETRKEETRPTGMSYRLYIGFIVCYLLGVFFVGVYYLLWRLGVGRSDVITALLFGAAHGLASILLVRITLKKHLISLGINAHFYLGLFFAHIMFSLTAIVTFNLVTQIMRVGEIQP